jgi:hypothetical protein
VNHSIPRDTYRKKRFSPVLGFLGMMLSQGLRIEKPSKKKLVLTGLEKSISKLWKRKRLTKQFFF